MTSSGAGLGSELEALLDAAVARLSNSQRTFTEEDALASVWNEGFEITAESEPRFVMAREADKNHPRHWRLATQTLANNRLLDALVAGDWDGRDLGAELIRLETNDDVHYTFCHVDPRFTQRPSAVWEPSDREVEVPVPDAVRVELDAMEPLLLAQWSETGGEPWTIRRITETLGELGWSAVSDPGSWLRLRSWLAGRPAFVRVGRDYWVTADSLPTPPARSRLGVLPVSVPPTEAAFTADGTSGEHRSTPAASGDRVNVLDNDPIIPSGWQSTNVAASWTAALRTVNLVEGFIPVPKEARSAYPVRGAGTTIWEALRGKWFDTGDDLWVWLDREHDRLAGPQLAFQLEWCTAGERLRVDWTADVLVFRTSGVDAEVQREETRLVDLEALKTLRGGLGESYRRSLATILETAPEGLTFKELVDAMRHRQNHEIHRGTIRALLSTAGFIQHDGRWTVSTTLEEGGRRLRGAITVALLPPGTGSDPGSRVRAIRSRLHELVEMLQSQRPSS